MTDDAPWVLAGGGRGAFSGGRVWFLILILILIFIIILIHNSFFP